MERLGESSGSVVGYKVVGKVTAEDYQKLEQELQTLLDRYDDTICVLLNLQGFAGEEARAWLPDLKFGRHFRDKIARMAIVGDKRWEKWMTDLVKPFYARDAKFFQSDEVDKAWTWLREKQADIRN